MVTILPQLGQVREDLVELLDRTTVEEICHTLGHRWRERQLDPWTTLHLFILQVLHRNTAMSHLPHLSGERFSSSAYCDARRRLPIAVLRELLSRVGARVEGAADDGCWRGHQVMMVDGSGFSMPDTAELRDHFGQPGGQKPGCGFPVAHFVGLFDGHTGLLRDIAVAPLRTHDMACVGQLHAAVPPNSVLVGDRGFCSYAHFALLSQGNRHAVFRIHHRQIVDFRPHRRSAAQAPGAGRPTSRWVKRLGHWDQLVDWVKPVTRPKWMTPEQFDQLPSVLRVRELRWRIQDRHRRVHEVTLVTTLLDPQRYPAREIARLYEQRWQVEVDLHDLKNTLGMDVLKGKSVDTVMKELLVFVLVHNLIRLTILRAARRQRVKPCRISFIDAMRWLHPPKPAQPLPALLINPERPGRVEPRCIKRRMKEFPLMKVPRAELRKRLRKREVAA